MGLLDAPITLQTDRGTLGAHVSLRNRSPRNPSVFGLTFASIPVVWVTVGGRRSLLGAIVVSVAIEWFRQQLAITGSEYAIVVVGALLLVIVLVLPEGIVPWIESQVNDLATRSTTNDRTEALE